MDDFRVPWIDGEKIPDEHIRRIFVQPPGVPSLFLRSSLLIGPRGAGKTTLFRYQKAVHNGIALHISLATEFGTLTKETGLGPFAVDVPSELELPISGKAISLLAVSIAHRLAKKGVDIPRDALCTCLPRGVEPARDGDLTQRLSELKQTLASTALERFAPIGGTRVLPSFVSALGEATRRGQGPLLLLLDRAEMVLPPSLVPVIELLDQSSQYLALVAMRPGHASRAMGGTAGALVAGDNYALEHLGTCPRSTEWVAFAAAATEAQIGSVFRTIPGELRSGVIWLARDSLRTGLEVFARYLSAPRETAKAELTAALEDLRENQVAAAQRTLQIYHPDFRQLVNDLRAEALGQSKHGLGPVVLSFSSSAAETLFQPNRLDRFVEVGLRSGALCMPEGQRWLPGVRPTAVEIPPLLVWEASDTLPQGGTTAVKISRRDTEILKRSGGPQRSPSIFVAIRMRAQESRDLRERLQRSTAVHPNLSRLEITDGHVPAGVQWAPVIRARIRSARAVVADVTGMSPEVLFELGFAYGLRKPVIPAVSRLAEVAELPRWLGETQLGHYGDQAGIAGLISSILAHLFDPEFSRGPRPPQPIPGLAVWLGSRAWSSHAEEQFQAAVVRDGLKCVILDDRTPEETSIRRASTASLLVATLDGTPSDALAHYVCGAVAARPLAGYGKTLHRTVLVIAEHDRFSLAADGLRRCVDTVRTVKLDQIRPETEMFGKAYTKWAGGPERGRRN